MSHANALNEPTYQIKAVQAMTGLSADLIRAWERRYEAVSPVRGERNLRLYRQSDVMRLQLLKQAIEAGHSIGRIARFSLKELEALAESKPALHPASTAPALIEAIERLDFAAAESFLSQAALLMPPRQLIREFALPLLDHVGQNWGQPLGIAKEHLSTALLRSLLGTLLRNRDRELRRPPLLLGTLSGEPHELGVLLVGLSAASHGVPVCYLGAQLPAEEFVQAAQFLDAKALGLSFLLSPIATETARGLRLLSESLRPRTALLIGGRALGETPEAFWPARAQRFADLDSVEYLFEAY